MFKKSLSAVVFIFGVIVSPVTEAVVVREYNQSLIFNASPQSFWGPGGSSASFASSNMFGSDGLGVSYSVSASTGTVSGAFDGLITGRYQDEIGRSQWLGRFAFSGLGGKTLSSLIGAKVGVIGHALGGDICILCADYLLSANWNTGPALDQLTTARDTLTAASPGVGANIGVGSVKAGVDLNIEQDLSFKALAVSAKLTATRAGGGVDPVTRSVYFDIDGTPIDINLDLVGDGDWMLQFSDIELVNVFDNNFTLGVSPFVQYTLGVRCGDPGTNRDNSWFCISDDKATYRLAGVSLYDGSPFELDFSSPSVAGFVVRHVPEPGSLALLMGALGSCALYRRKALGL